MQWVLIDGPRGLPGSRDEKLRLSLDFVADKEEGFWLTRFVMASYRF
jgi:hypothetical protein